MLYEVITVVHDLESRAHVRPEIARPADAVLIRPGQHRAALAGRADERAGLHGVHPGQLLQPDGGDSGVFHVQVLSAHHAARTGSHGQQARGGDDALGRDSGSYNFV